MEKNTYKSDLQKGNVEKVGNYRPICTPPTLYKLFSTTMCNRLHSRRDQAQSEDQGGFRRSYQTLDHLATYRLLEHTLPPDTYAVVFVLEGLISLCSYSLWRQSIFF